MRSAVKGAVVLLVTLPVLAYVAGRLAAAPPDPDPLTPVILEKPASSSPPTPRQSQPPSAGPREDDRDDRDDRDEPDDDDIRVVNPTPSRLGEDDPDDAPDDGHDDGPDDGHDDGAPEDDGTDDDSNGGDD